MVLRGAGRRHRKGVRPGGCPGCGPWIVDGGALADLKPSWSGEHPCGSRPEGRVDVCVVPGGEHPAEIGRRAELDVCAVPRGERPGGPPASIQMDVRPPHNAPAGPPRT
jgi:hypothetical protein